MQIADQFCQGLHFRQQRRESFRCRLADPVLKGLPVHPVTPPAEYAVRVRHPPYSRGASAHFLQRGSELIKVIGQLRDFIFAVNRHAAAEITRRQLMCAFRQPFDGRRKPRVSNQVTTRVTSSTSAETIQLVRAC